MAKELTDQQRDELTTQFAVLVADNMDTKDLVRYDLRLLTDRAKLHDPEYRGWAGGYLYLR